MFAMTIVFGTANVPWTLLFKTKENYDAAIEHYRTPTLTSFDGKIFEFTDDFGQFVHLRRDSIHGALFEDMNKSKLAHIERGLHQMRTQMEANNQVRSDPALMSAARQQQQGPGVITPVFGPNGAFRQ